MTRRLAAYDSPETIQYLPARRRGDRARAVRPRGVGVAQGWLEWTRRLPARRAGRPRPLPARARAPLCSVQRDRAVPLPAGDLHGALRLPRVRRRARARGVDRRARSSSRAAYTSLRGSEPESDSPRSQNKPVMSRSAVARNGCEQVLVGRVLRAAGVRVRHPHRGQPERLGEHVVGQRAAEVRQDRRLSPPRCARSMPQPSAPTDAPGSRRRRAEDSPSRAGVDAHRAESVARRGAGAAPERCPRDRRPRRSAAGNAPSARAGIAFTGRSRVAGDEGEHLEAAPAEDSLGRREARFAPFGSIAGLRLTRPSITRASTPAH